jgi:hypothetical protein
MTRDAGLDPSAVMRGLDPRIHQPSEGMDCRVKPGKDAVRMVTSSKWLACFRAKQIVSSHEKTRQPASNGPVLIP